MRGVMLSEFGRKQQMEWNWIEGSINVPLMRGQGAVRCTLTRIADDDFRLSTLFAASARDSDDASGNNGALVSGTHRRNERTVFE